MMSSTTTTTTTTTNQLEVHQRRRRRRRRTTTVLVALACAGAGALSVQYHALTPGLLRRRLEANYDDDGTTIVPPPFLPPFPLVSGDGVLEGMMPAVVPPPPREEEEVDAASASASAEGEVDDPAIVTHSRLIDTGMPLPPYSIEDAVRTSRMFDNTQAILVYDPEKDTFYALYSKRHNWVTGCNKLLTSFRILTYLLRRTLPERFMGAESDELVIPISSGDYPSMKLRCLDHFRKPADDTGTAAGWRNPIKIGAAEICGTGNPAPVLHFGSVFRQPRMFPNIVAMPMPTPEHLYCIEKWAIRPGIVCRELRARTSADDGGGGGGGLVFGEEAGLAWEDLIPQVVWRGTDFSYLTRLYPRLRKPIFKESLIDWPWQEQNEEDQQTNAIFGRMTAFKAAIVKRRLDRVRKRAPRRADSNTRRLDQFNKAAAVRAMREQYDDLLPRWKAVVLTGEAEVDAAASHAAAASSYASPGDAPLLPPLPWANMKFSSFVGEEGHKTNAEGSDSYRDWESISFPATGEYMRLPDLARYKYQIDLGGGGGTTWTGTIQKLALPGLLFHHVTPTKDYFHDYMREWVHYIPVSSDLRDLKRKYDWAESHPVESRRIADAGTNLARYLISPEGMEEVYNRDIVEPLRRVIEAYQPLSVMHGRVPWRNWREAIRQIEGADDVLMPVFECESHQPQTCQPLQGQDWWKRTYSIENKRKRFG